jgi:hypothetical protein
MSLIATVLFTLIALRYFRLPYLWISLCWCSCFVYFTRIARKSSYKAIWFNLAFLFIAFGFIEGYSWGSLRNSGSDIHQEGGYRKGYFASDEILGYAPTKGKTVDSSEYKGKEIVYNVTYTIGDDGLRVSPPSEVINDSPCILFFGDSFTFGEGLEDNQTMPYLVGELSKYKVYNFGFHGYGPHQMLSALEHGVVDEIVKCKPRVAVYQALVDHVARSAGLSAWDKHGPKYSLSDGVLKYDGHFDDHSSIPPEGRISTIISRVRMGVQAQIEKSSTYKKYFANRSYVNAGNVEVFLAIVDASKNKFTRTYPGSAFHVVLWDEDPNDQYYNMVREGLEKKGINLHLVSSILPNFSDKRPTYEISPYDKHPNALANTYIARYVVQIILCSAPLTCDPSPKPARQN